MNEELELSYTYNRQILKFYSKSFFISTLLLPRKKRKAVFALYGFCRFADNLVDKPRNRSRDDLINEIQYLGEELKVAYHSGASEHPVLAAFVDVAKQYKIPIEYPCDLFKGLLMDVEHQHYKNFDDLHLFCHRVAGVIGLMMTHILGYTDNKAFDYASKLGIAMQLTNILRDVQEDKNNNRIYLPLEDMEKFNVNEDDILKEKYSSHIKELIKFSANRAHQYYEEALPGVKMLTKECQFAIYSASDIYRYILDEIRRNDYNPFIGRVFTTQTKKIQIILSKYFKVKFNLNKGTI